MASIPSFAGAGEASSDNGAGAAQNIFSYADDAAPEWGDFRGANNGYTHGNTPRAASEIVAKWTKTFDRTATWNTVSAPIIANGYVYVAVSNRLYKLGKDGSEKARADLGSPAAPANIGYASFIAYGGGMIFVPLEGGDIQAFDADTLDSVWIANYKDNTAYPKVRIKVGARYYITDAAITTDGVAPLYKAETQALYKDGYLYCGVYYLHSNVETYGTFFAIDTTGDDASQKYENKPFAWEYEEPSGNLRGYYWAGVAAAGDHILFAGDAGVLHAVKAKPTSTSTVTSTADISSGTGSFARAGMMYEKSAGGVGKAWLSTKSGMLWSVPFNESTGMFGAVASAKLSSASGASIPIVAGSKVYALSGFINGGGKLDVFDKNSLVRKSTIDFGGYSQSSPLISNAYATAANGNKVYLYIALNELSGDSVIVIEDSNKLTKPKSSVLYHPGGNQSLNSIIADSSGVLYFADGKGRLTALGSKKLNYDPVDDVHKILLNANGGTVAVKSYEVINGKKFPAVATPVRKGYTPKGWYFDTSYKTAYKAGATVALSTDKTIYAKWSAKKYKVKFNVNKGKALKKSLRVKTVTFGKKFGKLPSPTRKGYKFKGWYTKKKGGVKITSKKRVGIVKTTTLYARWKKK
jgi:uncharacterized repeat protein (TIGR02543 family)